MLVLTVRVERASGGAVPRRALMSVRRAPAPPRVAETNSLLLPQEDFPYLSPVTRGSWLTEFRNCLNGFPLPAGSQTFYSLTFPVRFTGIRFA